MDSFCVEAVYEVEKYHNDFDWPRYRITREQPSGPVLEGKDLRWDQVLSHLRVVAQGGIDPLEPQSAISYIYLAKPED